MNIADEQDWWAPAVWPHIHEITWAGKLPDLSKDPQLWRIPVGMFGPMLAACIMRAAITREGFRGSLGTVRPAHWYLIAAIGPALFIAAVILMDHATGDSGIAQDKGTG